LVKKWQAQIADHTPIEKWLIKEPDDTAGQAYFPIADRPPADPSKQHHPRGQVSETHGVQAAFGK
jgi:hypothetical protein